MSKDWCWISFEWSLQLCTQPSLGPVLPWHNYKDGVPDPAVRVGHNHRGAFVLGRHFSDSVYSQIIIGIVLAWSFE